MLVHFDVTVFLGDNQLAKWTQTNCNGTMQAISFIDQNRLVITFIAETMDCISSFVCNEYVTKLVRTNTARIPDDVLIQVCLESYFPIPVEADDAVLWLAVRDNDLALSIARHIVRPGEKKLPLMSVIISESL